MGKKKKQVLAPKVPAITQELALKLFKCLEVLAEHDTYGTKQVVNLQKLSL